MLRNAGALAVDPCGREDDQSVILEVSDMVTVSVAEDGHLKSMDGKGWEWSTSLL